MATPRRKYDGPTQAKRCSRMIGAGLAAHRCEGRAFKRGECKEHYFDAKHASQARQIDADEFRAKAKQNGHGRISPPSRPISVVDADRIQRAADREARRQQKIATRLVTRRAVAA